MVIMRLSLSYEPLTELVVALGKNVPQTAQSHGFYYYLFYDFPFYKMENLVIYRGVLARQSCFSSPDGQKNPLSLPSKSSRSVS